MPLNGTKTHPLSDKARDELRLLKLGPKPRQEINPGVANRLEREGLIETYEAPTPYRTRKVNIAWVRITDAGRAELERSP